MILALIFLALNCAAAQRIVTLSDFKYCSQLSGASLKPFPKFRNLASNDLVTTIDEMAERFTNKWGNVNVSPVKDWFKPENFNHLRSADMDYLRRYACFLAINKLGYVMKVNHEAYFPLVSYKTEEKKKKDYKAKMAVLILAHYDFATLKNLVLTMAKSKNVFVLVHIDKKNEALIKDFVNEEELKDNVRLSSYAFQVYWGHSSILTAVQACLFELMDIAEWSYVSIISGDTFPLHKPDSIIQQLQENGKTIIGMRDFKLWHFLEHPIRLKGSPVIPSKDDDYAGFIRPNGNKRLFTANNNLNSVIRQDPIFWRKYIMHDVWSVLARSFVEKMRSSDFVILLHASLEFGSAVHEYFFHQAARLLYEGNSYGENIEHRQIMFTRWPKLIPDHPITVTPRDLSLLLDMKKKGYLYTRKMLYSDDTRPLMNALQEEEETAQDEEVEEPPQEEEEEELQ